MAGMAWTLHPALLYDKYGPVLIQLWDSGALSNLFRPVRRLSESIGDAITSGFTSRAPPAPAARPGEDESVLHITDESVATDDEAWTRVNREPGDTTPEPSTSQQNELAFQGDLYTQMRRNRRQQERIEKIRESRQKFVDGGAGYRTRPDRRGFRSRSGSILSPKKGKGVGKTVRSSGTPLADMECASPVRAVVIDVHDSSDSGESLDTENVGKGAAARSTHMIRAEELRPDNDSLRAFREISGRKHKACASPPPEVHGRSDPQSERSSLCSVKAAEAHTDTGRPHESVMTASPEQAKRSFMEPKESEAAKRNQKLLPPSEERKNLQDLPTGNNKQDLVSPKKSILRGRPAEKMESKVSQKCYTWTREQAPTPPSATASESCTTTGIVSVPGADVTAAATTPFKQKSVAGDDSAAPTMPTEVAARKDKTKRRKHMTRRHRKRSKEKLKATLSEEQQSAEALQAPTHKGTKQERRTDNETELRRKLETWDPSQDNAYQLASSVLPSSASKDSPEAKAATSAKLPAANVTDTAARSTTPPRQDPMRPTGAIADQEFYTDMKWLQEGKIPTLPTNATPMVHTKIGIRQRCVEGVQDNASGGPETPTSLVKSALLPGADPVGERSLRDQAYSGSKEAERQAVIKPSAMAAPEDRTRSTAFTTGQSPPSSHHGSERHKKHPRKRRSKPPPMTEEVPPQLVVPEVAPGISNPDIPHSSDAEGVEKTIDEAVAPRHRSRRSRTKKHGGLSGKARRKAGHAADLASAVSEAEVASATHADDGTTTGAPQGTEKPDAPATHLSPAQAIAPQSLAASTAPSVMQATSRLARPLSTDFTLSGISSGTSTSEQRPANVTVVQGDEVRIHLNLTGHNRRSAFWPFGRKSHRKKT